MMKLVSKLFSNITESNKNKLSELSDNLAGANFQNIQKIQMQNFLLVFASPASTGKNWQEKIY